MSPNGGPHDAGLMLGVDGGGTKTLARIGFVRGGVLCVLGSGSGPGSNPLSVGWDAAQDAIRAAADEAFVAASAHTESAAAQAAVLAIAGCASRGARGRLLEWASRAGLAPVVEVVPDTEPLLAGIPDGAAAVGLIAGTGSSVVARARDGTISAAGGWGYLVGDEGSGYWLGREAIAWVVRRHDAGVPPAALTRAVLRAVAAESPADLKRAVYQAESPRAAVASVAPAVLACAQDGDHDAIQIAECGAELLAELAGVGAARAGGGDSAGESPYPEKPSLVVGGGLLERSALYRGMLRRALARRGVACGPMRPAPDAATACALLAARLVSAAA